MVLMGPFVSGVSMIWPSILLCRGWFPTTQAKSSIWWVENEV